MHDFASFNGQICDAASPTVSALASWGLYGKGVFTTIAIYDRDPFRWKKHWTRLERDSAKVGIDLNEFSEAATRRALEELIDANSIQSGRTRVTFFDESATPLWPYEAKRGTSMLITTAEFQPVVENFKLDRQ